MSSTFDIIANKYDVTFTETKIGKAQRNSVRAYLEKLLKDKNKLNILELNCGTGEDAIWFAKQGHLVLATDLSEKMLEVTEQKVIQNNLSNYIKTQNLDLNRIDHIPIDKNFDLIFSNFGGMNCLAFSKLAKLPHTLHQLLKPSGRMILVIMPDFCLWETLYFSAKLNFSKAFRRSNKNGISVKFNNEEMLTFYYSPKQIKKIFAAKFSVSFLKPIGFFVPPSYLEKYFSKKQRIFNLLMKLESFISNRSFLSSYSDHYLIELKPKR